MSKYRNIFAASMNSPETNHTYGSFYSGANSKVHDDDIEAKIVNELYQRKV